MSSSAILSSQLKDLETDGIRFRGRNGHPQRSMNIAAIAVLSHLHSSQFHHYMLPLQRRRRQGNHSINFDDYLMKGDYRLDRLDRKFASDFFVYEKVLDQSSLLNAVPIALATKLEYSQWHMYETVKV